MSLTSQPYAAAPADIPRGRLDWPVIGMLALAAAYSLFLGWNFAPAVAAFDEHGYYAQGSLLAATGKLYFVPESPTQYIGQHWFSTPGGRYYSRHSPGLAVVVALVFRTIGPDASFAVNPLLAVLGLVGIFLLVRSQLGGGWGLGAALLLAANPTYNAHAIAGDAHMSVTVLMLWSTYLLFRWRQGGGIGQVLVAGLLLGCVPALRPPDALYGLGIALFLLMSRRAHPHILRHYAAAGAAVMIPIIPFLAYNHVSFGAFWKTAYGLTNEQTAFSFQYLQQHLPQYLGNLLRNDGAGLFFPLGCVGMVVMAARKQTRALGWSMLALIVPITLLYMAYYWAPPAQVSLTMRFLLPTIPLYILAGLWLICLVTRSLGQKRRLVIAATLVALHLAWGVPKSFMQSRSEYYHKSLMRAASVGLEASVADGSVIIANPGVLQQLDFLRHWRLADPMLVAGARGPAGRKSAQDQPQRTQSGARQTYSSVNPDERGKVFMDDLWTWANASPVYLVVSESQISGMLDLLGYAGGFKIIARIPMPELSRGPEPLAVAELERP